MAAKTMVIETEHGRLSEISHELIHVSMVGNKWHWTHKTAQVVDNGPGFATEDEAYNDALNAMGGSHYLSG